jgi:hypothetical protein
MHEDENLITAAPRRIPWNKGNLMAPDRRSGKNTSGQYEPGSRSAEKSPIWHCSISPIVGHDLIILSR